MKAIIIVAGLLAATGASAQGHLVEGYTRSNGTYVAPHYQSEANGTKLDNYSTQGNVNPYTGRAGTVDPYQPSQSNPYGSPNNTGRTYGGHPF